MEIRFYFDFRLCRKGEIRFRLTENKSHPFLPLYLGPLWLALRPLWLTLGPLWLALRPLWLALGPPWLAL